MKPSATPIRPLGKIFFDGVFKGDYSLAIVNRYLARALRRSGADLVLFSPEAGWDTDPMLAEMTDIRALFTHTYPPKEMFDVHLRNTWPPRADDMVGFVNAYVCFAWEEPDFPHSIVDHFNEHLDLVMVTAEFVARALRQSGVTIPVEVVGNGCDHVLELDTAAASPVPPAAPARFLHVSSCFPRKAADVLVETFAEGFAGRDDVELVIKTFPNPHNTIAQTIADLQFQITTCPPIKLVTSSIDYPSLISLYKTATALVAPSRGEGFGLPMAECMVLGVPVITTAYGGQSDFCSERTAWIVDHTLVPSQSHVAGRYSLWADPSRSSLLAQLQTVLRDRDRVADRSAAAKAVLARHYAWRAVADRVALALTRLAAPIDRNRSKPEGSHPSITLVTTWRQKCGIATYSEHLFTTRTMSNKVREVLSRHLLGDGVDTVPEPASSTPVRRVWSHDSAGIHLLSQELAWQRGDVVWIQHHPGFFSGTDMNVICNALKNSGYRVKALTMHNTGETIIGDIGWTQTFDVIFVHTAQDAARLSSAGYANPVVIPHGILSPHHQEKTAENRPFTVGTFGFLYPHKNIPTLLRAAARVREFVPDLKLKLLTCARADDASQLERARVESAIELHGLGEAVTKRFDFMSDNDIIEELAACDVIAFVYGSSTESATGAARLALAADRPLLCSRSDVLADLAPLAHVLRSVEADDIAEALIALAAHRDLLHMLDDDRRRWLRWFSYERIAARHLAHLGQLLENKNGGSGRRTVGYPYLDAS
jgi:glycosyltransferase involved in cell wall biosynthesis